MYYARATVKPVLASIAVLLLLLSGGIFAYATRVQSGATNDGGGLDSGSSTSTQTPQYVKFALVAVPLSTPYKSGDGYAYVKIDGHAVTLYLSVRGGTPGAKLIVVMPLLSGSSNHTVELGTVTLTSVGGAQLETQTEFDAGSYQIGLELYDVSTFNSKVMVMISNPTAAQVVITDQQSTSTTTSDTQTSESSTTGSPHVLQYHLVALPVAKGTPISDNYPFKEGLAIIYLLPQQIGLKVSFLGAPNIQFSLVLVKDGVNGTAVTVVTDEGGIGNFGELISLDPGTYQLGILLFAGDAKPTNLVALSDPRSATATIYARPGTTTTTTTFTSSTESNPGKGVLAFKLLSLPAYLLTAEQANYPFKYGEAGIVAEGTAVEVYAKFLGTPNTHFTIGLVVNGQNHTIGDVVTDSDGGGAFEQNVQLGQATFELGLLIFTSTSAGTQTLVGLSVPRTQTLVLPAGETTTTTTSTTHSKSEFEQGPSLKFVMFPLPVFSGSTLPDNYPFTLAGASIRLDGTSVQVMISFMGAPNTQFSFVLTANGTNEPLGSATTSSTGSGGLESTINLAAGDYHLGLLAFSPNADQPSNLVAVSIPRAETARISDEGSTASSSFHPMTFSFRLNPATEAGGQRNSYKLGRGEAGGIFADGFLAMYTSVSANPNTKYSVLLSVNGTSHQIANLVTDKEGNGKVITGLKLGNGTFVVGMTVNDTSSFSSPRTVLVSDPPVRLISTRFFEEETTTKTTTESESGHQGTRVLKFNIVGVKVQNPPATYTVGKGLAYVALDGQTLVLGMAIKGANPNTEYSVSLSINGTSTHLGSLVTNHEGNGEIRAQWSLAPGTYLIGVLVYDTSSFSAPTLVMTSDPASLTAVIVPSSSSTSSRSTSEASHSVSTITGDKGDEDRIKLAVSSLTIPAVVHVGGSNATFSVIDPRFSVSVGRQANHGIIISISATNVTGPRILLVNLTQGSFLKVAGNALNITLDGSPIAEASSVTQVLNPSPNDPARYAVVATTSGIQLLISIPHFSLHYIQIIPIPVAQIQAFLAVNAEALAASVIVITVVFAAIYRARQKIFSIFI